MLPYIKEYEPPRRRLRIKNRIRLTIVLLIIFCTLSTLFIHRTVKSQVAYKPYTVAFGDTYWSIARGLQAAGYGGRKDIRDIKATKRYFNVEVE